MDVRRLRAVQETELHADGHGEIPGDQEDPVCVCVPQGVQRDGVAHLQGGGGAISPRRDHRIDDFPAAQELAAWILRRREI